MPAPTFGAMGARLAGNGGYQFNLPVPAGVVANSVIVAVIYTDSDTAPTINPLPSGFQAASNSPVSNSAALREFVFWKRASGSDSGTYNFAATNVSANWATGWAMRIDGCITTGNPFDVTASAQGTGSTSYPTIASQTTTGADELLLWLGATYDGYQLSSAPSGFTIQGQGVNNNSDAGLAVCTKTQAAAGATGSMSATANNGTNGKLVWFGALKGIPAANTGNFFALF